MAQTHLSRCSWGLVEILLPLHVALQRAFGFEVVIGLFFVI